MTRARVRIFVVIVSAAIWAAFGLVPGVAGAQGQATITVEPEVAEVGESLGVSGEDWPADANLVVELCGDAGHGGSATCAVEGSRLASVEPDGSFSMTVTAAEPPVPCPCVVRARPVAGPGARQAATVELRGVDARPDDDATAPAGDAGPRGVRIVEARLEGRSSWTEWFAGPTSRTVVVTVENAGTTAATFDLDVRVGTSVDDATETVAVDPLEPLAAGEQAVVEVHVPFDALTIGSRTVVVDVPGQPVATEVWVRTTIVPWGLLALAAVVLAGAAVAARLLVRRRRRARAAVPAPAPAPVPVPAPGAPALKDLTGFLPPIPSAHSDPTPPDVAALADEDATTAPPEGAPEPSEEPRRPRRSRWHPVPTRRAPPPAEPTAPAEPTGEPAHPAAPRVPVGRRVAQRFPEPRALPPSRELPAGPTEPVAPAKAPAAYTRPLGPPIPLGPPMAQPPPVPPDAPWREDADLAPPSVAAQEEAPARGEAPAPEEVELPEPAARAEAAAPEEEVAPPEEEVPAPLARWLEDLVGDPGAPVLDGVRDSARTTRSLVCSVARDLVTLPWRLVDRGARHGASQLRGLAGALWTACEGIPGLVVEAADRLRQDVGEPATRLTHDVIEWEVAEAVLHSVQRRVGELSAPARTMLSSAVSIGHEFTVPQLADRVETSRAVIAGVLREAAELELVREIRGGRFCFAHSLVRAVLRRSPRDASSPYQVSSTPGGRPAGERAPHHHRRPRSPSH